MSYKAPFHLLTALALLILTAFNPTITRAANNLGFVLLDNKLFDLNTGAIVTIPSIYDQLVCTMVLTSPDGRHAACMIVDDPGETWNMATGRLMVAPIDSAGRVGPNKVIRSHVPVPDTVGGSWMTDRMEYTWSPDSRWLIYHWRDSAGISYLEIADSDGHDRLKQSITLNGYAQFDAWSADGIYLSAFLDDRFAFIKVPELRITYALPVGIQPMSSLCGQDVESVNTYCSVWSPNGHLIAYGRLDPGDKARLVITNPDQSTPVATFDVPTGQEFQGPLWSPDGRYIALFSIQKYEEPYTGRIELMGFDGSHDVLTDSAPVPRIGEGRPYVNMRWCDAHTLFFEQNTQEGTQVIGFEVIRQQRFPLTPGAPPNPQISFEQRFSTLVDCRYDLQQWSGNDADYAGLVSVQADEKLPLIDHRVDVLEWRPGNWAVARWGTGMAWAHPDGTGRRYLIFLNAGWMPLDWSADGQWMLLSTPTQEKTEIGLVNMYTGEYRRLLDNAEGDIKAVFSPDGRSGVLVTKGPPIFTVPTGKLHLSVLQGNPVLVSWSPDSSYFILYSQIDSTLDLFQGDGIRVKHFKNLPTFSKITWL